MERELSKILRLVITSSACPNAYFLEKITRNGVKSFVYKYESSTLDDILSYVIAELGEHKVERVAFLLHSVEDKMFLCGIGNMVLSSQTISQDRSIQEFFTCLSSTFMDTSTNASRIDFLDTQLTDQMEISKMSHELEKVVNCPVKIFQNNKRLDMKQISKINGEIQNMPVMEAYFLPEKLEGLPKSFIEGHIQNLKGYSKVKTVGKGAFGTAVLYKKNSDDSYVIVKEINMHDLTASERQLAFNEVSVLSLLNHENIVSYYDRFEQDGVLMIEMEYADGGTLAQYLSQMKNPIEEKELLLLFKQIVSAIKHMHAHNILHRDLKTANIFLTKEGTVKVGDFGISKMLTTKQGGAMTVVGTPYYISPEMCEGKFYNQKSDIWALGCILYEMACQQKTFDGSNLPALVNKIVKGQFAPVKGNYSPCFKQLIRDLLQRDPDLRPTAAEILDTKLPELLNTYETPTIKEYDDTEISMDFDYHNQAPIIKSSSAIIRSVLYDLKLHHSDLMLNPMALPPRTQIRKVALSSSHMLVLTSESLVFSWGDGRKGQLGHGKLETWRRKPLCVEALKGKNISNICAGEGFSVFLSDNGIVMTCGNGSQGCLGHGDFSMCIKPKIIEKLLSVDIISIACGPHHVVVIGSEGDGYGWGCGSGGRLGTSNEETCCSPTEIIFPSDVQPVRAHCGYDGSMFITEKGSVLACGRNDFNKLGLNEPKGFLMQLKQLIGKTEIEKQTVPVKLGWLRQKVTTVSMGANHTAVLLDPGKLIMFGLNKSGQLGRGSLKNHSSPAVVKSMEDKTITMVQCGDTFTVVGTSENILYFWGSRQVLPSLKQTSFRRAPSQKTPKANKKSQKVDADLISEVSETSVSEIIKIGKSNSPLMAEIERMGPDSPIIQVKTPTDLLSHPPGSSMSSHGSTKEEYMEENQDHLVDSCTGRKDVVLHPIEILALYASPAQLAIGQYVTLASVYCFGTQVYLAVDTTAPVPTRQKKKQRMPGTPYIDMPLDIQIKDPICAPEMDTLGPIPDWLQKELANATVSSNVTAKSILKKSSQVKEVAVETTPVKSTSLTNFGIPGSISPEIHDEKIDHVENNVNNIREIELENEIVELRKQVDELRKFMNSKEKQRRVDELELLHDDYQKNQLSKDQFYSKRGNQTRNKNSSRLCIVQ